MKGKTKQNHLQNLFLRVILQTPKGTPKTALKWDTGTWPMKHRIYFRKLTFANAIKLLNEESLAKQIWEEQVKNEWPGLSKESVEICRVLELPNIVKEDKKKIEWKKSVKEKCKDDITNILINEMKTKSKVKDKIEEKFERKDFLDKNNIY